MSVSFCLPHPVAVSAFMICRGLCACTEMLWMCVTMTMTKFILKIKTSFEAYKRYIYVQLI